MMGSPATSDYPGTLAMLVIAGFSAFLVVKFALRLRNLWGETSDRQGLAKEALGVIVAAVLLLMALGAIWVHVLGG